MYFETLQNLTLRPWRWEQKSRVADTFNRCGAAEYRFPDRQSCLMVPVRKGKRGQEERGKKDHCVCQGSEGQTKALLFVVSMCFKVILRGSYCYL